MENSWGKASIPHPSQKTRRVGHQPNAIEEFRKTYNAKDVVPNK